jgi:DNA-binding IclR family transcriptional regulator
MMRNSPTPKSSIQVIERSVMLLDAIAGYDEPASLKVLSADTGLHPSTAFRILGAMACVGFVERDAQGRYLLGRKLAKLAQKVQRGGDIRREALPIMEGLRDQVGETVNLSIRAGDEVVYVERKASQKMIRVEQVIGSRAPLHVTGVGKLMLGTLGEDFIRAYAKRTGLPAYTEHTLPLGDLLAESRQDVEQGYAFDNQEAEEGVGCISALVYDTGGEVAGGLSISAPIERRRDEWIPLLKQAAKDISERLGYTGKSR